MKMTQLLVGGALAGLLPLRAGAQRLLFETAFFANNNTMNGTGLSCVIQQGNRILVNGDYFPVRTTGCQPSLRAFARVYALNGILLAERQGRGLQNGESNLIAAPGGGAWWAGRGYQCPTGATSAQQRPYLQRLTAIGDTLPGWWLAPLQPPATTTATLAQGSRLLTAGMVSPPGTPRPGQQVSLTCSDTLGRVLWTRAYPRGTNSLDFSIALAPTPRGGYLLSGDAWAGNGYRHYLVETDSVGALRRQALLLPLGPAVTNGIRSSYKCNILTLPNAQGYLLSGTADSLPTGQLPPGRQLGYIMRLDTALNIRWVYRHPPALGGTGTRNNIGWRIRLLPNNTVGLVLTDVRGRGTPTAYLAQVDIATGRRVGFYVLNSNAHTNIESFDWQWVGDGTLLLAGRATTVGVTGNQAYLARWDFRNTPLAAGRPTVAALALFSIFPNPGSGPLTLAWQLPPGSRAGQLCLLDALGRQVRALPLPATAAGTAQVPGLPPGLYVAHLLDAAGHRQGGARKLLVE